MNILKWVVVVVMLVASLTSAAIIEDDIRVVLRADRRVQVARHGRVLCERRELLRVLGEEIGLLPSCYYCIGHEDYVDPVALPPSYEPVCLGPYVLVGTTPHLHLPV